jgi:hypothetical protein
VDAAAEVAAAMALGRVVSCTREEVDRDAVVELGAVLEREVREEEVEEVVGSLEVVVLEEEGGVVAGAAGEAVVGFWAAGAGVVALQTTSESVLCDSTIEV